MRSLSVAVRCRQGWHGTALASKRIQGSLHAVTEAASANMIPGHDEAIAVEVPRPMGVVPNRPPGTNEFLAEFPAFCEVPAEAAASEAETMYPEYMKKARQLAIQRCSGTASAPDSETASLLKRPPTVRNEA